MSPAPLKGNQETLHQAVIDHILAKGHVETPMATVFDTPVTANRVGELLHAHRPLKRCCGKHFQQELLVPAATAAFHDEAALARMLF